MSHLTTGTVAFSNLTEHDVYKGKSTGKYNVVLRLDDSEAAKLADLGVNLNTYEGVEQRKFSTKYGFKFVDLDENPVTGELGAGTEVRVAWSARESEGNEFGTLTDLIAVRVVQLVDPMGSDLPSEF